MDTIDGKFLVFGFETESVAKRTGRLEFPCFPLIIQKIGFFSSERNGFADFPSLVSLAFEWSGRRWGADVTGGFLDVFCLSDQTIGYFVPGICFLAPNRLWQNQPLVSLFCLGKLRKGPC